MHHALEIPEIILNIFCFCRSPHRRHHSYYVNSQLTALATTCKAFKEPALDMIWAELDNLSPLVRCLPNELWTIVETTEFCVGPPYSLKRPLEGTEWDIVLRYARRLRKLPGLYNTFSLTPDSIKILSSPPDFTQSIFQSLRTIEIREPHAIVSPLMRHLMNSPMLTDISLCGAERVLGSALDGTGGGCPQVTDFCVQKWEDSDTISSIICHWQELRSAQCIDVGLNMDAISHLSRLRNLCSMCFKVNDALVDQIQALQSPAPILTFVALRTLELHSSSLVPIGRLLHHFRVPVLHTLCVRVDACLVASDLTTFFMGLQEALDHAHLEALCVYVREDTNGLVDSPYHNITSDRLQPLTVFVNIKHIIVDVPCRVDLNEHEFLGLASSWPCLEAFQVGGNSDWTPSSGITPGGFLQLLALCRSLRVFSFRFNTRGYTRMPLGDPWSGLRMPRDALVHLLHSSIEEESVEALGIFFCVAPFPEFELITHWEYPSYRWEASSLELRDLYCDRWMRVCRLAYTLWEERIALRHSLEA